MVECGGLETVLNIKDVWKVPSWGHSTLFEDCIWRGGRVVECGGLENRCAFGYREFESPPLRQNHVTK